MLDQMTMTFDPGELAMLERGGVIPFELPADATDIAVMLVRAGGIEGYVRDQLIVTYDVKHIALDSERDLSLKLALNLAMGTSRLDVTLFPPNAVVERVEQ